MKKKMVIWLLTLVMAVSTVAGCGSSENTAPTSDVSAAADDVDYAPVEYEPAAEYPAESSSTSQNYKRDTRDSSSLSMNNAATSAKSEAWYDTEDYSYVRVPDASGEKYTENEENGFFNVMESPLSTFAADVDTASYSNMRRFVNEGYGLYDFPAGSIRAEELINYFKYDYAAPKNGERFGVDAQVSDCPWNKNNKLMILGVNTKELKEKNRPDSNIVFLLDVSGSMSSANKLPLLKEAMGLLADNLTENDRVSIVTYASGTNVVLDGVKGDQTSKINRAFDKLKAGGSTNGEGGIELAYEIAQENFIKGGNNRIILATDGDFNVGSYKTGDIEKQVSEAKESGVFISALGFGMGNYRDHMMETIADKGNGNYAYINDLKAAQKALVQEFSGTMFTVAKDTKFQVEFNPAVVEEYRLIGYEKRLLNNEDFNDDTKDAGEIGAGHTVTVLYEIRPVGSGEKMDIDPLKYGKTEFTNKDEVLTVKMRYKDPNGDKSKLISKTLKKADFKTFDKASTDFHFASAAAAFGQLLRDSQYLNGFTAKEIADIASKAKGEDENGDRAEFVKLIRTYNDTPREEK